MANYTPEQVDAEIAKMEEIRNSDFDIESKVEALREWLRQMSPEMKDLVSDRIWCEERQ